MPARNPSRRRFLHQAATAALLLTVGPLRGDESRRGLDYYGGRLDLPASITRIATVWEAQNAIIAMLGYGDRIVGSTRIVRQMPLFRRFVPGIADSVLVSGGHGGDLNLEALLQVRAQILFTPRPLPPAQAALLESNGTAIAVLHSNSMAALLERTRLTGEMLGPLAADKARDYLEYFAHNRQRVRERLADLPDTQRVRVYHALGSPLQTSGRPSLNQDWMDLAGARNVAEHWFSGDHSTGSVSLEQVVAADPEVILAMRATDAQQIRNDPRWAATRAVRERRVLANPRGLFWWCRETSEQALQFLWLATQLYPQRFADLDLHAETRTFYRRFYDYALSDAEVQEFLYPTS